MGLFRHFHKAPFWSQLVLGLVAIFALPEIQATVARDDEQSTVINRSITQFAQLSDDIEQQSLFIAECRQVSLFKPLQAVTFCEFLTKSYRFDGDDNHPIRAGPFA
ncbi:secA translation cis-regulator SecM [Actinobacillus arthritidis]|uniref:secA translation cis-regulator SecM n=1 Tax=Actinobacillus arthritidis TaxID=157339 RepID=UPI0024431995|nr:secA translation cis-regulator SecM [Actinobacillus arthritidis]WGE88606.1 secA translation cis-regulator SecM [Actinobacillus arthritidis]